MNEELDPLKPASTDFSMMDYDCSYIPGNQVRMNYKYVPQANKKFTTALVARGWRRFGKYFVHPICFSCSECKSVRIDVKDYKYSKSQKKSIRRNTETKIIIQEPTLTKAHLDLYNKYHAYKSETDSWQNRTISQREYYENFVDGAHDFGKEVLYIVDDKIVAVDLIDILDDGISSIYFYYDPDYSRQSLGTYSLLYQIQLAQKLGLQWVYLGYWVDGCKAFTYKENFQPQEILDTFPLISQEPLWELWEKPERDSKLS